MKAPALEGAAFGLILGVGLCADSLAGTPGGVAVLLGGVALSGLLVHLARSSGRRAARSAPKITRAVPLVSCENRPAEGKKKAATVVATPQRQVKHRRQANILRFYFTEKEGTCQMKNQKLPTMEELSDIITRSLEGVIPAEAINVYASHNYESNEARFNLWIRYPSFEDLCPRPTTLPVRTVSIPTYAMK